MANTENRNPGTTAEMRRQLIGMLQELEPEETKFILQLMETVNKQEPARRKAMMAFAEAEAGNYNTHTEEGRAAFMEALQAV